MYYAEIELFCDMSGMHPDLIKGEIDDHEKSNSRWVDNDKINYVYNHTRPNGNYGFWVLCTSKNILIDILLQHHYGNNFDNDDIKWVSDQIKQLAPDRIGRDIVNDNCIDPHTIYDDVQEQNKEILEEIGSAHGIGAVNDMMYDLEPPERDERDDIINADDSDLYNEEFSFQDHEDETVGPRTGYE